MALTGIVKATGRTFDICVHPPPSRQRLYYPTAELIVELQARGVEMTSAIAQMQAERKPKAAVAGGGKVVTFPKR